MLSIYQMIIFYFYLFGIIERALVFGLFSKNKEVVALSATTSFGF